MTEKCIFKKHIFTDLLENSDILYPSKTTNQLMWVHQSGDIFVCVGVKVQWGTVGSSFSFFAYF